ncbi:MAG: fibronectin type III-like domain-contianing protein, partial [Candidatus Lokiarchaeota archaeon]
NIKPLFPFGYGLSYTTFKYDKIKIEDNQVAGDETIRVSVELENTGNKEGAEVIQLYLHDTESRLPRPFKELKRFKKVFLKPQQKETINFELNHEDLAFFDEDLNDWVVENGSFKILIGSSSEDIRLETEFIYSS